MSIHPVTLAQLRSVLHYSLETLSDMRPPDPYQEHLKVVVMRTQRTLLQLLDALESEDDVTGSRAADEVVDMPL